MWSLEDGCLCLRNLTSEIPYCVIPLFIYPYDNWYVSQKENLVVGHVSYLVLIKHNGELNLVSFLCSFSCSASQTRFIELPFFPIWLLVTCSLVNHLPLLVLFSVFHQFLILEWLVIEFLPSFLSFTSNLAIQSLIDWKYKFIDRSY